VAYLALVRSVSPSWLEMVLSLAGSVFMMLAVFSKPLGLSDDWFWPLMTALAAFWIPLLVAQRRRRNARLASGLPPLQKPPANRRFGWVLILVVAVSLSGPLWLPYTGVALPRSTLLVTSVIGCALAVIALILSWRYWKKKSNQWMNPTGPLRSNPNVIAMTPCRGLSLSR
jgi:hypothetical protein